MSGFIPKEKLTAYQRWELAAFDEEEKAAQAEAAAKAAEAQAVANEPPVVLPTAADVERIHSEAYESGYTAGYEEGATRARDEAAAIAALGDNLERHLQQLDQDVAQELLAVAVEVASQVVRQSLRLKPELLVPVVREAITALSLHHGHPALFLHPDDATLIRQHLGEQLTHNGWRIIEDGTLERGGCRIEAGASEVDATLKTRWRRVLEAIGTSSEWLEDKP